METYKPPNLYQPSDRQDASEEGTKQCPMNNCGNAIADDEEICGEHK